MVPPPSSPTTPEKSLSLIAKSVIFIIFLVVRIGDGVRYSISLLFRLIISSYKNIIQAASKICSSASSFIVKLKERLRLLPLQLQTRIIFLLGKTKRFIFPRITWPNIKVPRFSRSNLPRIHMSFSWPHFPTLFLPSITKKEATPKTEGTTPPSLRLALRLSDQIKLFFTGVVVTLIFIVLPFAGYTWLKALPSPKLLAQRDIQVTTKLYDRHGALLYEIYADQNRTPIPLPEIPPFVKQATIAIEDKDFYKHSGFSITGMIRAAREDLLNHDRQGGSTITQQLIKSALLTPEISLSRKVKEIVLASWAEYLYTKDQILEMYLNQVPYGGTAWGVEAASQTYFGKSVKDLTLGEAALLAGLPQAPTLYSPFGADPQKAFVRQRDVLRRMRQDKYITAEQEKLATEEHIEFAKPHTAIRAPHFVMYVKNALEQKYGPRLIEQGGLRITTSLDLNIQNQVDDIVQENVEKLASLQVGNGAALVTNPKTGEILAMTGSRDYFDLAHDGNVNVTTSMRQPGSSIKVVTYATALENGFTAATILDDSPIVYNTPGSPPYAPVNYDGRFHGPTPLRYALANSYNIPAVKTLAKVGLPAMMDTAKKMGVTSWEDPTRYGLSLTLGGGEVTMLEMAQVFGTLANQGKHVPLLPILEIRDYAGNILEKNTPKSGTQAILPETAWILGNILSDNTARASAFGPNSSLVIPGKTVSVKTGTTNDKRDNWAIGYTPSYVTTVWVGNNDNSPMNPYLTSGITGASPIWHDIMVGLLKNAPDETFPMPESIVSVPCYFGRPEYFIQGTEPKTGQCIPLPPPLPTPTPISL